MSGLRVEYPAGLWSLEVRRGGGGLKECRAYPGTLKCGATLKDVRTVMCKCMRRGFLVP